MSGLQAAEAAARLQRCAGIFGFVPLPAGLLGATVVITIAYVPATEVQKDWFYRAS